MERDSQRTLFLRGWRPVLQLPPRESAEPQRDPRAFQTMDKAYDALEGDFKAVTKLLFFCAPAPPVYFFVYAISAWGVRLVLRGQSEHGLNCRGGVRSP